MQLVTNIAEFEGEVISIETATIERLVESQNRGLADLQGYIMEELSGEVLHVRTGALRRSIRLIPAELHGNQIGGEVTAGGGPIVYARIHEYGGDIYPRRAKALRFKIGNRVIFSQHVHMPERSYMRRGLTAKQQEIIEDMRAALVPE